MAFRAAECMKDGLDQLKRNYIPKDASEEEWHESSEALDAIVREHGPVVHSYPSWHPLVRNHDPNCPVTYPSSNCGYMALDHVVCFVNAFLLSPYNNGDTFIRSLEALPVMSDSYIHAEPLDVLLYSRSTKPILVICDWNKTVNNDCTIPAAIAIPAMLEHELQCRHSALVSESWDTMRTYLIGTPCGSRSSLFVDQPTVLQMKHIWNLLIKAKVFGPLKR